MNVVDFIRTIYLGDRGLKSILIDSWNSEVKIQVTCISRVRGKTWNYYTKEDLPDGFLVFEGVRSIEFEPTGVIPNDLINDLRAEPLAGGFMIVMQVDSVNDVGDRTEVLIRLHADSMALEDHAHPGRRITQ
jgi:hypothetical protein